MTEKAFLKIEGMHCTSCARLIELSLKDKNGVDSVAVEYESGEAVIEFDPARVDRGAIGRAIEALGYGVVGERPA